METLKTQFLHPVAFAGCSFGFNSPASIMRFIGFFIGSMLGALKVQQNGIFRSAMWTSGTLAFYAASSLALRNASATLRQTASNPTSTDAMIGGALSGILIHQLFQRKQWKTLPGVVLYSAAIVTLADYVTQLVRKDV